MRLLAVRLCAARAPRRRARVALCALGVLPERAALDEGDFPAPPLSSSTNQLHLRQVSPGSYNQHYGRRSHLRPGLLTHVNAPVMSNLDPVPSSTGNHRADTLVCNQDLRLHPCWETYRVAALCLLQDQSYPWHRDTSCIGLACYVTNMVTLVLVLWHMDVPYNKH